MRFNDRAMALAGIPDLPIDAFKKEGGKIKLHGGGGGPTTTKSETSNIPEYARPYVERMMGSTEKQIYTYGPSGNITGFQPFKSYSEFDKSRGGTGETVAGFTPMQAGAMQGIGNYQLPGQTAAASQLAGMGGMASFGAGSQAMGAGSQYARQATDPNAMQSYMSPYIQSALDPQIREVGRQSAIQKQMNMADAAKQGAFGGSRQGIVEAERQRNLAQQQSDIYGKGMQTAFEQARQAQQFGAELGLKGYETGLRGYGQALEGAKTVGALGEQQYKQELGLLGQQYDVGSKQQQYEQNRLNQIIQDYATKQQYPFIQLGTLSNMLRGLPMQSSTTQLYQAQPSFMQQGLGAAGAFANMKQAGMFAEGGDVKEMASGGIASGVNRYKLDDMIENLSDKQLEGKLGGDTDPETMGIAQAEKQRRDHIRGSVPKMAGGGAVAFKEGDKVENPFKEKEEPAPKAAAPKAVAPKAAAPAEKAPSYQTQLNQMLSQPSPAEPEIAELRKQRGEARAEVAGGVEGQMERRQAVYDKFGINPKEMYAQEKAEQQRFLEQAQGDAKKAEYMRYAQMWAKFGSTPGPVLKAALTAINETVPDLLDDQDKTRMIQRSIKKTMYELDKAEYLEKKGEVDKAAEADNSAKARAAEMTLKLGNLVTSQYEAKMKPVASMAERESANINAIKVANIRESAELARNKQLDKRAEAQERKQEAANLKSALTYVQKETQDDRKELASLQQTLSFTKDPKAREPFEKRMKEINSNKLRVAKEAAAAFNVDLSALTDEAPTSAPTGEVDKSNPLLK